MKFIIFNEFFQKDIQFINSQEIKSKMNACYKNQIDEHLNLYDASFQVHKRDELQNEFFANQSDHIDDEELIKNAEIHMNNILSNDETQQIQSSLLFIAKYFRYGIIYIKNLVCKNEKR